MLELFVHVLIGNIDVTCLYYVTSLADILEQIEWNETDDIRIFFANIYPFLDVSVRYVGGCPTVTCTERRRTVWIRS